MSFLDQLIRVGAADGLQINLWPTSEGFQANVKERGASGWTCVTKPDAVDALTTALSQRVGCVPDRTVGDGEPSQIDIEDVIANEDLIG